MIKSYINNPTIILRQENIYFSVMKRVTLRNILMLYILLPTAVYFLLWWGCQPMKLEDPPVELLAQEVSFSLGRDVVSLPLVAVSSFGKPNVSVVCPEAKSQACGNSLLDLVRLSRQGAKPIPVEFLESSNSKIKISGA
jgi:hypothetical protein